MIEPIIGRRRDRVMRGQRTLSGVRAGKGIGARPTVPSAPGPRARSSRLTPAAPLLQRKYRELTRKHLSVLTDRLFADLTGLHFHIAWAPSASSQWEARMLPTACSVCCRIAGTSLSAQPVCRVCGPKQLARALGTDGDGLSFKCRLGVFNYWLPIRVRGVIIGIAYLQALDATRSKRAARATGKVLSGTEFNRASRLLRLIVQYVQTLNLAQLRKAELTTAGYAVVALEREQARLHEALQRHLPAPPQIAHRSGTETRSDQTVRRLMQCISEKYPQPITLRTCAATLGMNAAYASALFSRKIGRPFKAYLTELRLEKAKALLGEPARSITEVACAVGYASENRFRIAFKKGTGLSPRLWRETMQTNHSQE